MALPCASSRCVPLTQILINGQHVDRATSRAAKFGSATINICTKRKNRPKPPRCFHLVPDEYVEAEVDVEVLVMVVMEDGVRLPGLPPKRLEVDSRVVNDAVVIRVEGDHIEGN